MFWSIINMLAWKASSMAHRCDFMVMSSHSLFVFSIRTYYSTIKQFETIVEIWTFYYFS